MNALQKKTLKYMLLPEFLPRFQELFRNGFSHLSYLLAVIYQTLNLLPQNHPYLHSENLGRYGIRHVIAVAADNLVLDKRNADQILIFLCTLMGLALLFLQFVMLIIALIFHHEVFAQTNGITSFPSLHDLFFMDSVYGHGSAATQGYNGAQDIAFIILDRVFGVADIFNSCISRIGVNCVGLSDNPLPTPAIFPFPFHRAMHALMAYYTYGIFVISIFIILYFFTTIVGETVVTGSPFGQRMNRLWAPIRLIVFFALLLPIHGSTTGANPTLNGAQLITLWTAKIASNFATNAWGYYADTYEMATGNPILMSNEELIARPKTPDISNIVAFMFLVKVCHNIEGRATGEPVNAYAVSSSQQTIDGADLTTPLDLRTTGEAALWERAQGGNLIISFGYYDPVRYGPDGDTHMGAVKPVCGRISVDMNSFYSYAYGNLNDPLGANNSLYPLTRINLGLIRQLWTRPEIIDYADCFVNHNFSLRGHGAACVLENANTFMTNELNYWTTFYQNSIENELNAFMANYVSDDASIVRNRGWAGAALWYNQIAKVNGDVVSNLYKKPQIRQHPLIMEIVAKAHLNATENVPNTSIYDPELPKGRPIKYEKYPIDQEKAQTLYKAHKMWNMDAFDTAVDTQSKQNFFIDAINWIYGTNGIFSMRENADAHPLAQLSSLGRSMLEATVRNLGIGAASGLASLFGTTSSVLLKSFESAFWSIGLSMITMSIILYYILPFLPFIYFMFAVSGWIKSIFEAVVAMPLWALAHVRIDGEGLPGKAASNGYYLLLEIFLRPVLILFGLIASLLFFSAMVAGLNDIFELVVSNVGGFDKEAAIQGNFGEIQEFLRGPIDEFFYTAIYVIICYMMGLSCFKLVDLIPNKILRWAGVSVKTIQEGAGDPASKITKSFFTGGTLLTSRVSGGMFAILTG